MNIRRQLLILLVGAVLLAPGGTAALADGRCTPSSVQDLRAMSRVVFEGIALGSEGVQLETSFTEAWRFRVTRYLKGSGPDEVKVVGGPLGLAEGGGWHEPGAGEKWRVYASRSTAFGFARKTTDPVGAGRLPEGVLASTPCHGSHRIGADPLPEIVRAGRLNAATAFGVAGALMAFLVWGGLAARGSAREAAPLQSGGQIGL